MACAVCGDNCKFYVIRAGRALFSGVIRKKLTDLQHIGNVHEIISR